MKKIIIVLLLSLFCILSSISTGFKIEEKNLEKKVKNIYNDQYYNEFSVMRVTPEILEI